MARLVSENEFLTIYIPATGKALVFRVVSIQNKGLYTFEYGPLPFTSGESLATYEGATTTVPADGVIPARAYNIRGKMFPYKGAYDTTDMWFLPEDLKNRVFHVIQHVTPEFLRIDVQIPVDVLQVSFQKDRVPGGVDKDFGFSRGTIETIHIPKVHYGYRWGNETNIDLYTYVKFTYGEYIIEIPKNAELIFNILTKRISSYWITLPITVYDATLRDALLSIYGFEGFKLYGLHEKDKAISEYSEVIREVKI